MLSIHSGRMASVAAGAAGQEEVRRLHDERGVEHLAHDAEVVEQLEGARLEDDRARAVSRRACARARSTRATTPWRASVAARVSPVGPAPTMRMFATCASRLVRGKRAAGGPDGASARLPNVKRARPECQGGLVFTQ